MRSQKQNNRSPRPFKMNNAGPKWTGGSGSTGFIPGPAVKPVARVKKVEAADAEPEAEAATTKKK